VETAGILMIGTGRNGITGALHLSQARSPALRMLRCSSIRRRCPRDDWMAGPLVAEYMLDGARSVEQKQRQTGLSV